MQSRSLLPHTNLEWTIGHYEPQLAKPNVDPNMRIQYAKMCLSHGLFHGGGESALTRALVQSKKALHEDRNSVEALAIAGMALVKLERMDKAQQFLNMALQRNENDALVSFAYSALARLDGNVDEMLLRLERAVQLAPDAWEPHLMLGRMIFALSKTSKEPHMLHRALYHMLAATTLSPDVLRIVPQVLLDIGVVCLQQKRFADAEKFLYQLKEHPRYGLQAKRNLAEVAFAMKKYHNAIQRFRGYLNQKEAMSRTVAAQTRDRVSNADVQSRIAMSWLKLGDLRRAKAECQRSLQFDPHNLFARHTLGCIFVKEGAFAEGVREFRENLHQHPEYIESYREIILVYLQAGDWDWISQALLFEVSNYDRLPIGGMIDARVCTRERIQAIVDELKFSGIDASQIILPVIAMTQDELLRFQLWEAACDATEQCVGIETQEKLRSPERNYSIRLAEDALGAAKHIPLDILMLGLNIQYADIKASALERYPQANSLEEHQRNEKMETRIARSYQMMLLLACSFHSDPRCDELLQRWTSGQNDRNMEIATWTAWALKGHPEAVSRLAAMTKGSAGSHSHLQTLARSTSRGQSSTPMLREEDRSGSCRICKKKQDAVNHFLTGQNIQICDACIQESFVTNSLKLAERNHSCSLCGNTHLESPPLCKVGPSVVCNHCAQLSLGSAERAFVNKTLSG
jgi:tetratricopeptide (TPR) repeat protein